MDKQRVNLFLDPELVKIAKAKALDEGISLSDLIEKLIRENIGKSVKISVVK